MVNNCKPSFARGVRESLVVVNISRGKPALLEGCYNK